MFTSSPKAPGLQVVQYIAFRYRDLKEGRTVSTDMFPLCKPGLAGFRPKTKRCSFPITLPTLMLCPYPYLFIAQIIIFLKKKGKNLKLLHIPCTAYKRN